MKPFAGSKTEECTDNTKKRKEREGDEFGRGEESVQEIHQGRKRMRDWWETGEGGGKPQTLKQKIRHKERGGN